jgi:hypothetical protein
MWSLGVSSDMHGDFNAKGAKAQSHSVAKVDFITGPFDGVAL